MNRWQNFKDDFYAHWNLIRYRSGYLSMIIAIGIMAMWLGIMLLAKPEPPSALVIVGLWIFLSILMGWGTANTTLPSIVQNKYIIRYRYKLMLKAKPDVVSPFAQKHGMTFHSTGNYEDDYHEYGVTRAEHAMLLKLRF